MSERSVAKIVGWRLVPSDSPGTWPPMWHGPNGEVSPMPPRITVDDLLAWLRDRVYDLEMMYQAVGYMVEIRRTRDSDARPGYLYGDTLLAALELAVRAVAGES